MSHGATKENGHKATAQLAATTAEQYAAAVAIGAAAGGVVGVAAAVAGKSVWDSIDSVDLRHLQDELKHALENHQANKMVDEALQAIVKADRNVDEASGMGKVAAVVKAAWARLNFQTQVKGTSTTDNRDARDHALDILAQPNGQETEGALKFILDTINQELDRRDDARLVLPLLVPTPGFCGTTVKFVK